MCALVDVEGNEKDYDELVGDLTVVIAVDVAAGMTSNAFDLSCGWIKSLRVDLVCSLVVFQFLCYSYVAGDCEFLRI